MEIITLILYLIAVGIGVYVLYLIIPFLILLGIVVSEMIGMWSKK